jgi:hypothetical protein
VDASGRESGPMVCILLSMLNLWVLIIQNKFVYSTWVCNLISHSTRRGLIENV